MLIGTTSTSVQQSNLLGRILNKYELADGRIIGTGLVLPEDADRLVRGYKKLSLKTKMFRFHYGKNQLSSCEKDYLVNVDNYNHLALGAVDLSKSYDVGIAVIRYIRDETDPTKAEVALTVIDEYQNRGIGIHLYNEMLEHACKNGIKLLVNCVIKENTTMLNILKKFGGEIVDSSGNQYRIEVELPEHC
ncbi:GNAT family N-acetyltransferase [Bacteroidota bacterium]